MLRQVSSRNQRPKSLRISTALQISLLLAVTIWLLYQLNHTYSNYSISETDPHASLITVIKETKQESFDLSQKHLLIKARKEAVAEQEAKRMEIERLDKIKNITDVKVNYEDEEEGDGTVDAIDEQDLERESEEEERGERGDGRIEESDARERSRIKESEARERSFKGDDVSSAVFHPETQLSEIDMKIEEKVNLLSNEPELPLDLGNETGNKTSNSFTETGIKNRIELLTDLTENGTRNSSFQEERDEKSGINLGEEGIGNGFNISSEKDEQ